MKWKKFVSAVNVVTVVASSSSSSSSFVSLHSLIVERSLLCRTKGIFIHAQRPRRLSTHYYYYYINNYHHHHHLMMMSNKKNDGDIANVEKRRDLFSITTNCGNNVQHVIHTPSLLPVRRPSELQPPPTGNRRSTRIRLQPQQDPEPEQYGKKLIQKNANDIHDTDVDIYNTSETTDTILFIAAAPMSNNTNTTTSTTTIATPVTKKRRRPLLSNSITTATTRMNDQQHDRTIITPPPPQSKVIHRAAVVTPMECTSSLSSLLFFSSMDSESCLPNSTTSCTGSMIYDDPYHDLYIPPNELRPSRTLITGQCFHWRAVVPVPVVVAMDSIPNNDTTTSTTNSSSTTTTATSNSAWGIHNATEWIGNLRVDDNTTIIVMIQETPTTTLYRTIYTSHPNLNVRMILYQYFQYIVPPNILKHNNNSTSTTFPMETISSSSSDQYCNSSSTPTVTAASVITATSSVRDRPIICLSDLYEEWSTQCHRMKVIASHLPGVRILHQDPFHCLLSFLCSSNNNIPRITKMISSIQRTYGTRIGTIPYSVLLSSEDIETGIIARKQVIGWEEHDIDPMTGDMIWYAFPSLQQLISSPILSETELRTKCGMGYRAKYMMETIQLLHSLGGEQYLHELRQSTDPVYVQEQLLQFKGIGRKVADCIALFSLQQHQAIPVDVHVWNIARRDYQADDFLITSSSSSSKKSEASSTTKKTKSLTPTIYKQIGDLFRNKFPSYSGWAHSLLFVAELPSFRAALPVDVVQDMDTFREEEKARKVAQKQITRDAKTEKEKVN